MSDAEKFDGFAIVELFGHQVIAGRVSEQMIAGAMLLRVDVPDVDGTKGFTKFYGNAAIYSLTPTGEREVMGVLRRARPKAIDPFLLPEPSKGFVRETTGVPDSVIDLHEEYDYDPRGDDDDQ